MTDATFVTAMTFQEQQRDSPQCSEVFGANAFTDVGYILIEHNIQNSMQCVFYPPVTADYLGQSLYVKWGVTAIPPSSGSLVEGRLVSLDSVFDEDVTFAV